MLTQAISSTSAVAAKSIGSGPASIRTAIRGSLDSQRPSDVGARELPSQLAVDRGQLLTHAGHGRSRGDPGDRDHRPGQGAGLRLGVRVERHEHLRVDERHAERGREDADERVRLCVDHER